MSIAYEFLKDDSPSTGDWEDTLAFVIDHYAELISMYRVIQAQHEETKLKKEKAHKELQSLRDHLEEIAKSGRVLSEQEKISIEAKKEYLTKVREEDDVIYFKGHHLEWNQATKLLKKFEFLFEPVESADRKLRVKLASISKTGARWGLSPLKRMLNLTIRQTKKGKVKESLKICRTLVVKTPDYLEKKFLNSLNINLNDHRPRSEQMEFEFAQD